ncbi:MAG: N-acetylmuramoyl-L-alanine amidase [Ruminococcaceae bacterium]|nr:N-acetylmuramoyl-L-alanine amidase [Oscillospiraceae bacterium]
MKQERAGDKVKRFLVITVLCMFVFSGCSVVKISPIEKGKEIIEKKLSEKDVIPVQETAQEPKAEKPEVKPPLFGKVIVVDAGHGKNSFNKQEPIAPGSSTTKIAFADGTRGKNQTEEQLNLKVSKKLQELLLNLGAEVHMTRTEHESDMTNVDRAVFANDLNADLSVKIHADGNNSPSAKGISMLVPSNNYVPAAVYEESAVAGAIILDEVVAATGGINRGVVKRNDLTGFNWSTVPIILLEMGFMTNPEEDALLETEAYQQKVAQGLANGIVKYFESK